MSKAVKFEQPMKTEPSPAVTFAAVVALAVVSTVTFAVLPNLVKGAQQSLHFSASDIGILAAMINAGGALGSVIAKYWVRRLEWRQATRIALAGLVGGNALSILFHEPVAFVGLQFVAGFFSGSLLSLTLTILSDRDEPDRDFGILIAGQVALQAAGLFAGPYLLHLGGVDAILGAFVLLTAGCFCLVGRLPASGRDVQAAADSKSLWRPGTVLALLGASLFMLSAGCYWTYIALIGQDAGFDEAQVARTLVVGVAAGFMGAMTSVWIGSRLPRNAMLVLGMLMIAASISLLLGHISLFNLVASWCLLNFSWNFSAAFQFASISSVDSSGRAVALAPAFQSAGASVGPAIAALFVAPHVYGSVMWLVVGGAVLSVMCFILAARFNPRLPLPAANAAQQA
ncbi:MAG TPA: MFS transporter [Steroidobacteraceae bacterium]|nr:MFS transporter [Steroidobacteraceae bacterium]